MLVDLSVCGESGVRSQTPAAALCYTQPFTETSMAFYELRRYKIFPGKMDEWLRLMEETIIPFQISKGMVITGSFRGEDDDSIYVWTRRFESEEQREQLYEAVYQSDRWKNEISPLVGELMDRAAIQVTRLVPSSKSPVQ
jgi:NIPSNAP